MFFTNISCSEAFPVARIKSVALCKDYNGKDRHDRHLVTLDDGTREVINEATLDAIQNPIIGTLQALPGYDVVSAYQAGEAVELSFNPVVGWAVRADGETRPLTARGINDGMHRTVPVRHPDGYIWDEGGERGYDTVASYQTSWAEEEVIRRERRALALASVGKGA
ncbi:hypothetical protein ACFSGX_11305 [Sphingomonas arantia]|uniref:Uncharacterized protein n=1 Tax=Sphingomonas arantia TaxID=1460676 RepID=A0ABW4TXA7_9SPHN